MELLSPGPRPHFALRAAHVTKLFGDTVALWDIGIDCRSEELLAIHGTNGSGKSTLLRILAGLTAPTRGDVGWTSDVPGTLPRIGLLGHATHLFDELTAIENVALAAKLAGRDEGAALDWLGQLGVSAYGGRRAGELSAGTRRRVGLARVLATNPDALLVDEPFAGLDASACDLVQAVLVQARDDGRIVGIATHDGARRRSISSRTVELDAGRIRGSRPRPAEALAT